MEPTYCGLLQCANDGCPDIGPCLGDVQVLVVVSKHYLLLDVGQDESVGPEGRLHHVQPHSPQLLPAKFNLNI